MARQAKALLQTETLEAVADRGYFNGPEILACHEAGITITLPKPMTLGAKSERHIGNQNFVYLPEDDAYRCAADEEADKMLPSYWTNASKNCFDQIPVHARSEPRITRWEHEHLLDAVQKRLYANPLAMRLRRETVELRWAP